MTYKEYYKTLTSEKEILEAAERDIEFAAFFNYERIEIIRKAAEEAINELESKNE